MPGVRIVRIIWGDEGGLGFDSAKLELDTGAGRVVVRGEGPDREAKRAAMLEAAREAVRALEGAPS
jgi:hypothetical protein